MSVFTSAVNVMVAFLSVSSRTEPCILYITWEDMIIIHFHLSNEDLKMSSLSNPQTDLITVEVYKKQIISALLDSGILLLGKYCGILKK